MPLREYHNDHFRLPVKMGRKPPTTRLKVPMFGQYRTRAFPKIPETCSYGPAAKVPLAQMYMNHKLGCCVISSKAHIQGVFTGNAGISPLVFTDRQIVEMYGAIGDYIPGREDTDNGCDMQRALTYWRESGMPYGQNKIAGYVGVNASDPGEYKSALWAFENLDIGTALPDEWVNIGPGFTWGPGRPDPMNNHCYNAYGYDKDSLKVCTWGMTGRQLDTATTSIVTPNAGGELYVAISQASLNQASKKAPNGMDWSALVKDFNGIFGGDVILVEPPPVVDPPTPPPPPPIPPPPIPPTPPVVDKWVEEMLKVLTERLKDHPGIVFLLHELSAWLDIHLHSQKTFWPRGFTFAHHDMRPFQHNLWMMALNQLERTHPEEAALLGQMRVAVVDQVKATT